MMTASSALFDDNFPENEQLPRNFCVNFKQIEHKDRLAVVVTINGEQIGGIVTDNSYKDDGYRFHDIFHYSHAAVLGWSPCARTMLGKKRKSNPLIDEIEDGARAKIIEEAICALVFDHAQLHNFFVEVKKIERPFLETLRRLTVGREVFSRSLDDWESAILQGYEAWRQIRENNGGTVIADLTQRKILFKKT